MNNEPVAWIVRTFDADKGKTVEAIWDFKPMNIIGCTPLYTHSAKTLTDEEWDKAFDYYCETDEGVLKFDLELRDEWKKEQLIRWKEALRKAQEK
jgi:hypothetical protein